VNIEQQEKPSKNTRKNLTTAIMTSSLTKKRRTHLICRASTNQWIWLVLSSVIICLFKALGTKQQGPKIETKQKDDAVLFASVGSPPPAKTPHQSEKRPELFSTGPRFQSILSLTLAWSKWLVRRTIHKYERFFRDKDGFLMIRPVLRTILWNVRFLNCLVEVPQLHRIQRLVC
jgi:hypothetical protein